MKGLLINYDYCTGCHSCEVACKKERSLQEGEYGIKVTEIGPYRYAGETQKGVWEWTYVPTLTKACDLCAERTGKNKLPMCVQHCQAWCLTFGEIEDLAKKLDGQGRYELLVPAQAL